jgi:hypothetical protein
MRGFGQTCAAQGPPPAGFVWCPLGTGCTLLPEIPGCNLALTPPTVTPAPIYVPTSIVFTDVSKPGGPYSVGDQWTLKITGDAGVPVTATVSQNGAPASTANVGTTDETGNLTLTGTFGAGDAGSWQESYLVGSGSPATLSFNVQAPPAPGTQTMTNPGPAPLPPVTAAVPNFFTMGLDLGIPGLNDVPVWALLGGGVLLLVLIGAKK